MLRLADYFVVVGYDFEKSKHNQSEGKIIQRFPQKDWSDYKYEVQVEMFCQPCGWELSDVKHPPTFFIAYLTNTEANLYYLACLSFHEAICPTILDQHNGGSLMTKKITNHSRNLSNTSCTINGDSNGNTDSDHDNIFEDPNLIKPADQYAPKCLILVARHGCLDILKNCLSIIYSIYMDPHREISLEYVIGNILSAVDVPPIGGSRISFSIGAGDRQIIQPPICPTLPVTRTCVSMLFKHLGMQNVLVIFSSLINDQKILLYSRSFNRLTDACYSLRSLLYPLKYGNVFIPIIPKTLVDVLSTPTPFMAGVHSTYRPIYDLTTDIVMVDLDGGSVTYPDNIPSVSLSEPYYSITIDSLTKILNPDLLTADEVYPPSPSPPPDPAWQDKQLRAVFIRLFCRLFAGYRSCLTLTRIRPKPVIHFNQSLFLLLRGLRDEPDEFISRLLSCMSFGQLIQDRGIPYRVCDVFDEEYESMTELLRTKHDSFDDLQVIDKLAKKLYDNECRGTPFVHTLPQEAKLAHTRLHTQPFQILDETLVADHIKTNLRNKASFSKFDVAEPRFVPHGLELDKQIFKTEALSDKNKVIREFVANIFNNHITEALKRKNTIRQDLKNRLIRRIFIDELYRQLYPDQSDTFDLNIPPYSVDVSSERKALLGYQQFELVNDLMGEALRQEGQNEESGVVPIIMELSTKFCTQLNNVRYYTNMTYQIQEHTVWESQKFWLTAFCDQVNNEIRQLYLHHSESQYRQRNERISQAEKHCANLLTSASEKKPPRPIIDKSWSHNAGVSSHPSLTSGRNRLSSSINDETRPNNEYKRILYTNKMSALDMAAEEMKIIEIADLEVQNQEEATVYAQILHFINLIVNFRIPLNVVEKHEQKTHNNHPQHQQSHTNSTDYGDGISMATSVSGGDNYDSESGYDDGGFSTARISSLETWIKKFVDKTASDNNLSQTNIENIKGKIEGIIEGHISNLEAIYPEVKNIPKVKKVEVTSPVLLPGERVILINNKESVRCYLLLDGRHEKLDMQRQREQDFEGLVGQTPNQFGVNVHGRVVDDEDDFDALIPLLPAQGALFITNYRVVFHGAPKDPYQSNKLVCRSFPIAGLKSVKKLGMKTFVMSNASISQGTSFSFITGKTTKSRGTDGSFDVIRIRSNTFQMLKIGLELEDSSPEIKEELYIKLTALRYPPIVSLSFNVTDKIDRNHQKFSYCTGLPEDSSFDISKRLPSESASSLYSSIQNYSSSPTVPSVQNNLDQKNNFGRNTLRLAKNIAFQKISKIKGRTSPSSMAKTKYISESESERSSVIHEDESKEYSYSITDAKLLDKLRLTPGYKEYTRLNMANFSSSLNSGEQANNRLDNVRLITNFNDRYQNVKSYQSMIVVPSIFNEASLKKVAKTHRKNRFPIITWKSERTGGYLLRGAGFQAQGIMGKLLKQTGGGQGLPGSNASGSSQIIKHAAATLQRGFHSMTLRTIYDDRGPDQEITAAREQIRYFQTIVDISPTYEDIRLHLSNVNPLVQWTDSASHKFIPTKKNPWEKAYQNMVSGGAKAKTLIKNEVLKMSSSTDDLNKVIGGLFLHHDPYMSDKNDMFKYADDDDEGGLSDALSQSSTCTTVGKAKEVSPLKDNKGYHGRGVRGIITSKNHSKSLLRPNSPSMLAAKTKQYKRNSDLIEEENSRSQSYNLIPSHRRNSKESIASRLGLSDNNVDDDGSLSTYLPSQPGELRIVPLYILGEKSQMKAMSKSESFGDIEFIAIDFTPKHHIKEAYELLVKAVLPDNVSSVPIISHLNPTNSNKYQDQPTFDNTLAVAANKWLLQVQNLLELAGTVVDLIDIQSASVAVCLEDGWDATSQIVSLAQVMLDPHYRTIDGFWALIEKDWLMSGHKFQSRLCMTTQSKSGNFLPIFLQFLDAVHQLLQQFPMSFEFNDFFLKFLAYHHTSNRFHNFKMDCEADRLSWMRGFGEDCLVGTKIHDEHSIWNYIVHHHEEWPVFFNFLFNPNLSQEMLRPCSNLAMIDIWEYYLNEDLASGSVYDLDHFCPSYRKRNTQHYNPILNGAFNNSHVAGVYAVLGLREGYEVKHWQKIWRECCNENQSDFNKVEAIMYDLYEYADVDADSTLKLHSSPGRKSHKAISRDPLIVNIKPNREHIKLIREICYIEHKNTSLLKLEKRHLESAIENPTSLTSTDINSYLSSTDHNLQRLPTQSEFQTICDICRNRAPLTGTVMIKCGNCALTCHDKCLKDFPRSCLVCSQSMMKHPSTDELSYHTETNDHIASEEVISPLCELSNKTVHSLTSNLADIVHERSVDSDIHKRKSEDLTASEVNFSGDLWKLSQHTLFPNWQKKYFTLDIIRHELLYSDSKNSQSNVKRIHIQDITGVRILTTLHNHQKRFPESAFLELQTEERTYKLASELPSAISEWMEKIQNSIQ